MLLLATCESIPNLTEDDQALIAPLAERGIQASPAVWSDPRIDWAAADAVIIRSCWDYHLRLQEFLTWISQLERRRVRMWNVRATLRWNANKSYLRDLENKGVAIVPTVWPEDGFALAEKMRELGWKKAVVKPRVSATAYRTQLVSTDDTQSGQDLLDDLLHGSGAMVQRFMETVSTQGEWSLIFFSGKFSHAVIKRPKAGDFRVQHDFGGSAQTAEPPDFLLQAAAGAIATVKPVPLYARIDGVESDGQFLLMELELLEPALFLKLAEGAAERFAEAIKAAVSS